MLVSHIGLIKQPWVFMFLCHSNWNSSLNPELKLTRRIYYGAEGEALASGMLLVSKVFILHFRNLCNFFC